MLLGFVGAMVLDARMSAFPGGFGILLRSRPGQRDDQQA